MSKVEQPQNPSDFQMMKLACFLTLIMRVTLAAVDDCPQSHFWNGTVCVSCSPCFPGFGVKTTCSHKLDTECEACIAGFDYSDTTGFERCFGCDEFSNCHLGNSKEVKKCTKISPRVCDGCQDGNYFNPGTGGCQECSPPCRLNEDEARPCSTKHDRMCSPKTTVSTTLAISSTFPQVSTKSSFSTSANTDGATGSTLKEDPPKSISSTAGDTDGVPSFKSRNQIGEDSTSSQETVKNPWLWIGIGVVVIAITIFGYKRKKRSAKIRRKRRSKRGANISTDKDTRDAQEMTTLMLGLDLPIKDLTIDGKTFIAQRLNGKGNYGYYYWQLTGEKLGFLAECKAWESAENPTEKLLKAYGEKEGSTIRKLIEALRQTGLTRFAKEIEDKFSSSTTQDQKKEECKVEIHKLS